MRGLDYLKPRQLWLPWHLVLHLYRNENKSLTGNLVSRYQRGRARKQDLYLSQCDPQIQSIDSRPAVVRGASLR